ncbi:MAG: hypothetical protein GEV11_05125 [Streptosporangiales bacterium]|nr:hypothetical protein [Streptosporangiales bacterium]
MRRIGLFLALGGGLLPLAVSGCMRSSDASVAEAGNAVASDARAALERGARELGATGQAPRLTGDTISDCDDGGRRRSVYGRAAFPPGPYLDATLDRGVDYFIALASERGYRLDRPPSGSDGVRLRRIVLARDRPAAHLDLRLHGGRRPYLEVRGQTDCL